MKNTEYRKLTDEERQIYEKALKELERDYDKNMSWLNCDYEYYSLLVNKRLKMIFEKQMEDAQNQMEEIKQNINQINTLKEKYKLWLNKGVEIKNGD